MTVTSNNVCSLNMRGSGCENDNDCFAGDRATLPLKSVRPMVVETLNWIVRLVSFAMYQLVSATKMTSLTVGPVL